MFFLGGAVLLLRNTHGGSGYGRLEGRPYAFAHDWPHPLNPPPQRGGGLDRLFLAVTRSPGLRYAHPGLLGFHPRLLTARLPGAGGSALRAR